jgi:hypothetical protein
MDIQKIKKNLFFFSIIFVVCFALFYKPLFSNQPLGLDALGHLSKISYLKIYPLANWDMSWYSGTLFLKLYPPLFYYLAAIFSNPIFATNFLSFLSIFLTSCGIFIFVKYLTKKEIISLFCGLSYLTVLSLSYYWISTANLPYFFSLWTIPFSLYFLDKTITERKKKDFIFYSVIFSIAILTHIVIGFLIGALMIIRILTEGVNLKNIKKICIYGLIPVLLSCFWFFPFLIYSNSSGGYEGQIPLPLQLFGIGDKISWGLQAGGMGVLFPILLLCIFVFFLKKFWRKDLLLFAFISVLFTGFLLFGGLLNHYPQGVDPIRFILPFSILSIIFIGLIINKLRFSNEKLFLILIFIILFAGLIWNFTIINQNFDRFSYYKSDSRYGIFQDILKQNLPIENNFTNYRFGTSKFVFGETLNYFMPLVSQTFGYQDAGMLNAPRYYDMRWNIYLSENVNDSIYWLDWFAIKYFESEGLNSNSTIKFENDSRFKQIMNYSGEYNFVLFEYLDAKPIISLVENLSNSSIGKEKEFQWERPNPDEAIIKYDSFNKGDVILFKEFYHQTWKAKDLTSGKELKIVQVGPGFMAVYPELGSKGVIFYQTKTIWDILGILLTLSGIFFLIKFKLHNL